MARDYTDVPKLFTAIESGDTESVRNLLSTGHADVNELDRESRSAFIVAEDNIDIVRILLEDPNLDVNIGCGYDFGTTALYYATERNYPDVVRLLLEHPNIDPNVYG
eukprot:1115_1